MAAQDGPEDSQINLNSKTWVLKVSIHCEGCKRKVKKILQQVPGVYSIEIDLKQQKTTVTGNVEGESLLRKLHKSGKNAELLPQEPQQKEKKPVKSKNKEKQQAVDPENKSEAAATTSKPQKIVKPAPEVVKPQEPEVKSEKTSTGSAKPEEKSEKTGCDGEPAGGKKVKSDEPVEELKSEGKKPETVSAGKQKVTVAVENKVTTQVTESENNNSASASGEKSGGPGGEASGKKKKKKGQNGNNNSTEGTHSSVAPVSTVFQHHDMDPHVVPQANEIPPRHPGYNYDPQYYGPPPPAYVVSYNTAQPASSFTTSYYAPAPPTSYAYTYPGPVFEPPPSDLDMHPRQPLDSFEMFSDENPNGCSVM